MRKSFAVALACVSLVALSDCGRKHSQTPAQTNSQQTTSAAPAQAQQQSSGGLFSPSCPQPPLKAQVEAGIKSALNQIYGADEVGTRIAVISMTPTADCRTLTVTYTTLGARASAPLARGDDGNWSIVLYKKSYPVP